MLPSQQEKPFEWDVQFSKSASDEVVVIVDARNMSDRITSELLNCSVIFFDAKSEIIKSVVLPFDKKLFINRGDIKFIKLKHHLSKNETTRVHTVIAESLRHNPRSIGTYYNGKRKR